MKNKIILSLLFYSLCFTLKGAEGEESLSDKEVQDGISSPVLNEENIGKPLVQEMDDAELSSFQGAESEVYEGSGYSAGDDAIDEDWLKVSVGDELEGGTSVIVNRSRHSIHPTNENFGTPLDKEMPIVNPYPSRLQEQEDSEKLLKLLAEEGNLGDSDFDPETEIMHRGEVKQRKHIRKIRNSDTQKVQGMTFTKGAKGGAKVTIGVIAMGTGAYILSPNKKNRRYQRKKKVGKKKEKDLKKINERNRTKIDGTRRKESAQKSM